jgi:hypothetical protein
MLPQPNFGRDREPDKGAPKSEDADADVKPRNLLRLQIAMWVQVVSAVLAGNILAWGTFTQRAASVEDLTKVYTDSGQYDDPAQTARDFHEVFQSTNFLVTNLVGAGLMLVAAIIAAMCIIRFKSRHKVVRWWAVGSTAFLFVIGMLMAPQFGLLVGPWVFASVLSLWWLFSSDIRYWLSESQAKFVKPAKEPKDD